MANSRQVAQPTKLQTAADTLDATDEPFLQLLLDLGRLTERALASALRYDGGSLGAREKVHNVDDAVIVDVSGLQDIGGWEVLLPFWKLVRGITTEKSSWVCSLGCAQLGRRRTDAEEASLFLV